jgi:hypothetical protein
VSRVRSIYIYIYIYIYMIDTVGLQAKVLASRIFLHIQITITTNWMTNDKWLLTKHTLMNVLIMGCEQ